MLQFFSGMSGSVNSRRAMRECLEIAMGDAERFEADLIIFHTSIGHNFKELLDEAKLAAPTARIVGCSCAGIIGREGANETMKALAVMVVKGELGEWHLAHTDNIRGHNSYDQAVLMASRLKERIPGTNMALLLASGIDIAADRAIEGIESVFGPEIKIFGGTSSDNMRAISSFQFLDDQIYERGAVLIGFADPTLEVEMGVHHGSVPVGMPFKVTRAEANRIYELDGKPAWHVLMDRLGQPPDTHPGPMLPLTGLGQELDPDLYEEYDNKLILRCVVKTEPDGSFYCRPRSVAIRRCHGLECTGSASLPNSAAATGSTTTRPLFTVCSGSSRKTWPVFFEKYVMSLGDHKRSYADLEALCADLEISATRAIAVKQDLIQTRDKLDRELGRYKHIQSYAELVLRRVGDFGAVTAESLVEAYEVEAAMVGRFQDKENNIRVIGAFGFEHPPDVLPFNLSWLSGREALLIDDNHPLLHVWSSLGLCEAMICPFYDQNSLFSGIMVGGRTKQRSRFYPEIDPEFLSSFAVMTEQAGLLLRILEYSENLEELVEKRTTELSRINANMKEEITERKRAEEKRRQLEARVQRAEKMEVVGTLAGGIAHDLNNILSALVSYPELLLLEIPEESPLRGKLLTIESSGKKAAAIVQDLLTLARRATPVMEVVNLNDIISDYLNSPEHKKLKSFHPKVEFELFLETDLLNTYGSPVHLSKTLMNLVTNAAEAMLDGGMVTISTKNQYVDRPIPGHNEVKEGDYTILSVADNGTGIQPEYLENIFEPFYTKKIMGRSGTGLGMSVVWTTVQDHKGYIDVQTADKKGTTFELYFPITKRKTDRRKSSRPVEEYRGNGENILVVDDLREQREIVSLLLTELGYSVHTVSSGEEAVEYLKTNTADLLLLDMIMEPGIDGLETYKKILQLHPAQKAIIASGFSETDRVKEALRLGVGEYIRKPYTIEKIGLAVKDELVK
jgi:signal transduction histidine kinase